MAVDQLKVAFSILKELSEDNYPEADNYGISEKQFASIVEDLLDRNYIKDARTKEFLNHGWSTDLTRASITLDGLEYLHENSVLMKTYRGLKEAKSWIPFVY